MGAATIPARRRRKAGGLVRGILALTGLSAAVALLFGGVWAKDQFDRHQAAVRVQANWTGAQALVAARLKQPGAIEYGGVWATHDGVVCGMVNGKGSFGGLVGMTPFYVRGGRAVFALDSTPKDFASAWAACVADDWYELVQGSRQSGFCATKAGASRCKDVAIQ